MDIRGLVFTGTRTPAAAQMAAFVRDVLGLAPTPGEGADFYALPDGSRFAVTRPWELDPPERSVGFLVADVVSAAAELREHGVPVSDVAGNGRQLYVHFRAPDGQLYELVEDLTPGNDP